MTYLVLTLGAIEALLQVIVRWLNKEFQWLLIKKDEYPIFDPEVTRKIVANSYDPELGWVRKPNTSGVDKRGDEEVPYCVDERGSRSNPQFAAFSIDIATYGDSYTFCREVHDHETWQAYLSHKTNSNVLNYGVGNYGFDQSLLRYKREHKNNLARVAVIAVVPETIVRIHSLWKHYSEYGNIFAFKPRFKLVGDKLQLVPNPITRPETFEDPRKAIEIARHEDYFYENKFKKDILATPMIFSLFKNPGRNFRLIGALLKDKFRRKKSSIPLQIVLDYNQRFTQRLYRDKLAVALFKKELQAYQAFSEKHGVVTELMMMPYLHDAAEYVRSGRNLFSRCGKSSICTFVIQLCPLLEKRT